MLGEHAAERAPARGKQVVRGQRARIGVHLLPIEKFFVKRKCLVSISCKQLMPADASGVAQVTGTREIGSQSINQGKRRSLRIRHHGNAADIAVRGRDVNGAPEMLDPLSCLIHVLDDDIPYPSRPRTHLQRLLRQTHQSANRSMPGRK